MAKKVNLNILAIAFLCIGVLLIFFGGVLDLHRKDRLDPEEKEKQKNQQSSSDSLVYYSCTKDTFDIGNFKIDYKYHFYFLDQVLQEGKEWYIYTFDDKVSYDSFSFPINENVKTVEMIDEKQLIKTYQFDQVYPQNGLDEETRDVYLEYMVSIGYDCKEDASLNEEFQK